jgi:shikimate dehydrogenase
LTVSRKAGEGVLTYEELTQKHTDVEVLLNTTPVGMYPNTEAAPVDISIFSQLEGVIDAIYNPLRTQLIIEAQKRGISAEGGLYMLVAQAVRASELFLDCTYTEGTAERIYRELLKQTENIVLSGMPCAGKSTVGKLLAEKLNREFFDLDEELVRTSGRSIPEIFATDGEDAFRNLETRVLHEVLADKKNIVLATGGGAILRDENIDLLHRNGRIYFIDRPLEALLPTDDRPLASSREAIEKRYQERYGRYCSTADCHIDGNGTPEEVAERIRKEFLNL